MSGHSKWSTIKRKKGVKDIARGKAFSKITRLISTSISEGGGIADPNNNFKLRLAIERARAINMPKDTIDRAIEKGSGGQQDKLTTILYEAFAPGGIIMLIEATTDNPNRIHSQIKKIIELAGGKMGGVNSVLYQFDLCGLVIFSNQNTTQEQLLNFSEKVEALDIIQEEGEYLVYLPIDNIKIVREVLGDLTAKSIEIYYRPKIIVNNDDDKIIKLFEALEELDDVQRVFSNTG